MDFSGFPTDVDFVILGAGIAGLRAAITLAEHGSILVVTKEAATESNTHYAQGGIAVAMSGDADVSLHLDDTVLAGDGLVHRPAAEVLVAEGPMRVHELIDLGAAFDTHDGKLTRTREAAHSLPRILHANGDATGAEISRALVAAARKHPHIHFAEWTAATHLVVDSCRVVAVDLLDQDRQIHRVVARSVLLATGGAGQVYSDTTNPAVATGDGLALALDAGAELADMEFYQFHPTAFNLAGAPRFLLSEALRGEGARLVNHRGERFMERYHPMIELAPRDIVARAITREAFGDSPDQSHPVFLDMRHLAGVDLHARFPGISRFLAAHHLDLRRDLIPVRPAAHYLMGGVRTDLDGRTTVAGLYAAGEVAATGVHGANRLASNSLLEGLVFGARAAEAIVKDALSKPAIPGIASRNAQSQSSLNFDQVESAITVLRETMWRCAGLLRDAESLERGLHVHKKLSAQFEAMKMSRQGTRRGSEACAMLRVSHAILLSALAREESRGAHFRNDFPAKHDDYSLLHSIYRADGPVVFQSFAGNELS
uniref:L-aspartate oxidase n=1 Tax=mine drainage metagenome TaxID=410659 RepID=E6PZ12_9ZZZZ